mmetsp:Transcript_8957/g.13391  ORF Transcript_8957/g.13391 Transcript_8957/m.13391 type:complete len:256 (-) Transcript_8957:49-816(-)|eukprot:CAMPEP_0171477084 /NCGR_PEP_ID=MMETSP0946-20130122/3975_1 /TAXON_ID=109269 /ORGANISM="Vaucheria litorea, Strain CCMP2940" /LENGTH=255 /DNA_ID=CAMNT_0012007469 /DNA_START=74 /DNA_END=841 /DNA_ORIENTATION=+
MDQLNEEKAEWKTFLAQSKVPNVQSKIKNILQNLEKDISVQNETDQIEKPVTHSSNEPIPMNEPTNIHKPVSKPNETPKPISVPEYGSILGKKAYEPIIKYAWDQGEYGSEWVTIYVTLEGVGTVKDSVTCKFTKSSFDLQVIGLNGKNYRLIKDNLNKEIDDKSSKFLVKKDKVLVKLHKTKGKYGPEQWDNLIAKRPNKKASDPSNPTAGIMDMMKDMYDEGDDNMKKIIGESMLKSRRGEKIDTPSSFKDDF